MNSKEEYREDEELRQNAPTLFGINKTASGSKGGLTAPDGYFDDLASRIQDKIKEEPSAPESKVISLFNQKKLVWLIPAAACIAVIFWIQNNYLDNERSAEHFLVEKIIIDDLEEMTVDDMVEEFTSFTLEEEDPNLLDDDDEDLLLAALDDDDFFDDFYSGASEYEEDEQASMELTEAEFESIESYFSGDSDDFDSMLDE
jgi:hypothetical protein